MNNCKRCMYFAGYGSMPRGQCRKAAPVLGLSNERRPWDMTLWPEVRAEDFCGEFEIAASSAPIAEVVDGSVLAMSVDELELTVRASSCLRKENILTIGDLIAQTELDLKYIPHLGRKCMKEIIAALAARGLGLRAPR